MRTFWTYVAAPIVGSTSLPKYLEPIGCVCRGAPRSAQKKALLANNSSSSVSLGLVTFRDTTAGMVGLLRAHAKIN